VSALRPELEHARWYHGKGGGLVLLRLVDRVDVPHVDGGLLAILATEYADGTVAEYAIPTTIGPAEAVRVAPPTDPVWTALARLAAIGGSVEGEHGTVVGVPGSPPERDVPWRACRPLEADQSNTSVVVDGHVVLKLYRRLRPGSHPEQELLAGLTRVRSKRAPSLVGSIEYRRGGTVTALATAYAHVEGSPVGWEPAIAALTAALGGPAAELDGLAAETEEMGRCAGELHHDLLSAFGGRPATSAAATAEHDRAVAGLAEAIQVTRPLAPELEALGPATRAQLSPLDRLEGTQLQRIHGDLHVGQLLRTPTGIVAIDFEGDPTLPTDARRSLASPLQDIASLLLSLDHVAAAAARRRGFGAASAEAFAWSTQARAAVISGYDASAAPGAPSDPGLLGALEVAKEWREAVYAAQVLPEWLYAPRLVLQKLLT
jgi:maltokinase